MFGRLKHTCINDCITLNLYVEVDLTLYVICTGFMESISTYKALETLRPNIRPFVLSRATFPGSGSYAAHWNGKGSLPQWGVILFHPCLLPTSACVCLLIGDNTAHDTDLYYSIPMMLSFQLFGMPFVGSDICGFFGWCYIFVACIKSTILLAVVSIVSCSDLIQWQSHVTTPCKLTHIC